MSTETNWKTVHVFAWFDGYWISAGTMALGAWQELQRRGLVDDFEYIMW